MASKIADVFKNAARTAPSAASRPSGNAGVVSKKALGKEAAEAGGSVAPELRVPKGADPYEQLQNWFTTPNGYAFLEAMGQEEFPSEKKENSTFGNVAKGIAGDSASQSEKTRSGAAPATPQNVFDQVASMLGPEVAYADTGEESNENKYDAASFLTDEDRGKAPSTRDDEDLTRLNNARILAQSSANLRRPGRERRDSFEYKKKESKDNQYQSEIDALNEEAFINHLYDAAYRYDPFDPIQYLSNEELEDLGYLNPDIAFPHADATDATSVVGKDYSDSEPVRFEDNLTSTQVNMIRPDTGPINNEKYWRTGNSQEDEFINWLAFDPNGQAFLARHEDYSLEGNPYMAYLTETDPSILNEIWGFGDYEGMGVGGWTGPRGRYMYTEFDPLYEWWMDSPGLNIDDAFNNPSSYSMEDLGGLDNIYSLYLWGADNHYFDGLLEDLQMTPRQFAAYAAAGYLGEADSLTQADFGDLNGALERGGYVPRFGWIQSGSPYKMYDEYAETHPTRTQAMGDPMNEVLMAALSRYNDNPDNKVKIGLG